MTYQKISGRNEREKEWEWIWEVLRECREFSSKEPELLWLQEKFKRTGKKYGIVRKNEIDCLVFQKMEGRLPEKNSELLMIRYWRTGHHKPQTRTRCMKLAKALELSTEETTYMLQHCFDMADRVFTREDINNEVYQKRLQILKQLERVFLLNVHPQIYEQINIPWEKANTYFRHCYFQKAIWYQNGKWVPNQNDHLSSINYESELSRNRMLMGEVPRKTMLRHIFLMNAPFLSVSAVNSLLQDLGYAVLDKDHRARGGEKLDLLLIRLLEQYERVCSGKTPEEGNQWLKEAYQRIDRELVEDRQERLRFLNFKSLEKTIIC